MLKLDIKFWIMVSLSGILTFDLEPIKLVCWDIDPLELGYWDIGRLKLIYLGYQDLPLHPLTVVMDIQSVNNAQI